MKRAGLNRGYSSALGAVAVAAVCAQGLACSAPPSSPSSPSSSTAAPAAFTAQASGSRTDDASPGNADADDKLESERTRALSGLFGTEWSRWVVEINNQSKDPKRPSLPSWFSVSARDALAAVFVAAESAAEESNSSAPIFDQLAANVANLNRELAANKVRFAVDLVLLPTEKWVSVLLFTFTLDRLVHYVASDGTVAEISWVKRFDSVAYRYRLLGFTGPGRQPVVLLGPIEDWLVSDLLVAAGSTTAGSRNISEGVSAALAEDSLL